MYFVDCIEKQWMELDETGDLPKPIKYVQQKTNRKGEKILEELAYEIYLKVMEKGYTIESVIKIFCGKDGYWRYVLRISLQAYYQRPLHENWPETFWKGTIWEGWEDYWKEEAEAAAAEVPQR